MFERVRTPPPASSYYLLKKIVGCMCMGKICLTRERINSDCLLFLIEFLGCYHWKHSVITNSSPLNTFIKLFYSCDPDLGHHMLLVLINGLPSVYITGLTVIWFSWSVYRVNPDESYVRYSFLPIKSSERAAHPTI